MTSLLEAKREALTEKIALYNRQYAEIARAIRFENNPATEVKLQMNLEDVERKWQAAEDALQALENEAEETPTGQMLRQRDNKLRERLFEIDFKQAKHLCDLTILHSQRRKQQPAALMLLHDVEELAGDLYLDYLKHKLQANNPELFHYPFEFGFMTAFSDNALRKALAKRFDVKTAPDDPNFTETLIEKICSIVGNDTTLLFEFRLDDDPFLHQQFPNWFNAHFWHPLVEQFRMVNQQMPRAKLLALIVVQPSLGVSKLKPTYFCSDDQFAAERFLHLPLAKWTKDDILIWLDNFLFGRGLTEDKIEALAEKLFRISEQGVPRVVWQKIEKELGSMM